MPYTTIDRSTDHFRVKTYTGNGADNRAITFDETTNMQPDFCWFKDRTGANSHNLFDVVRGVQKPLLSNSTSAELSGYDLFDSFNTNGFTVSGSTADNTNFNGSAFVNWSWKANGAGVSNTSGTISSTVSANTTSGFSIVSYTGNGSSSQTVGHGLGVAPKFYVIKQRSSGTYGWNLYHASLGATKYLALNSTTASSTDTIFNNTEPTSSVFSLGSGGLEIVNNGSSVTHIAYCFAEVKGFSKFGSFSGNGSTDGTFVYTGFKPAFFLVKGSSNTSDWIIFDNKRDPINVVGKLLLPNSSGSESNLIASHYPLDFVSNGVKMRTDQLSGTTSLNASGVTYIYMAFAESPFVSSKGIPTTAR